MSSGQAVASVVRSVVTGISPDGGALPPRLPRDLGIAQAVDAKGRDQNVFLMRAKQPADELSPATDASKDAPACKSVTLPFTAEVDFVADQQKVGFFSDEDFDLPFPSPSTRARRGAFLSSPKLTRRFRNVAHGAKLCFGAMQRNIGSPHERCASAEPFHPISTSKPRFLFQLCSPRFCLTSTHYPELTMPPFTKSSSLSLSTWH